MRWVPLAILMYLFVLVQTSLGGVLTFDRMAVGPFGPDFLALLTVFVALYATSTLDAMLAAWVMGLLLDLTTAGGGGVASRVGPMAIGYALSAGLIVRLREAIFRERAMTQMIVAGLFCILTHGFWITVQAIGAGEGMTWAIYFRQWGQVLLSALYTALLMPLAHFVLFGIRGMIMTAPPSRTRRSRR